MRIFDYLHYSSTSGLLSDSNFWFHKQLYDNLFKKYPDEYHFYITIPNDPQNLSIARKYLNYPNVTIIPIEYPWSSALARGWYDQKGLQNNRDKFDTFDMVFCNTVEVAPGLISYFQSLGDYCPLMNYTHWTPGIVSDPLRASYGKDSLTPYTPELKYFISYLLGTENFCNSKFGKKIIMNDLSKFFNDFTRSEIDRKLNPLYLTADANEFLPHSHYAEERNDKTPVLVFNYRRSEYTGFSFFIKAIKRFIKLYPEIKFKILFTSVGGKEMTVTKLDLPDKYILCDTELPRPDYIKAMWQSDIQLGTHIGLTQYSLSFIEGMFCNLIPLFQRGVFYDEFFENMPNFNYSLYSYSDEDDFIAKLHDILTDLNFYKRENEKIQKHFLKNWTWEALIDNWHKAFQRVGDTIRSDFESDVFNNIDPKIFSRPVPWSEVKKLANLGNQRSLIAYLRLLKKKFNLYDNLNKSKIELTNYPPPKINKLSDWLA